MYYIAVLCSPVIDDKIQAHKLWMRDRFGCIVALRSAAHITLIPPFWLVNEKEQLLLETLHAIQISTPAFTIPIKNFSHFGNKVIFAAVEENHMLVSLRKTTEDHFIIPFHDSIKPDDRPFHPHVTIANRDIKPGDFIKAWTHFEKLRFEETFIASKISLLKLSPGKWNVIGEQTFVAAEPPNPSKSQDQTG